MRTLTITMEHLPPWELNPNTLRRLHWSIRAKAVQAAKDEIGWLAKEQWQGKPPMKFAQINYEFHSRDRKKRDLDNLLSACKSYQDGLVDVGVLEDDSTRHLDIGSIRMIEDGTNKTILMLVEI